MSEMLLKALLLSTSIISSSTHVPVNTSEFLVVGGHADLPHDQVFITTPRATTVKKTTAMESDDEQFGEKDDVIFVPTEKDVLVIRNEDLDNLHEDTVKMSDVMNSKNKGTEPPSKDEGILFISGKNNERAGPEPRATEDTDTHLEYFKEDKEKPTKKPLVLDCTNLDCNLTKQSLCAGKIDRSTWRYRLFLNECFFRKVNCGFTYDYNRYTKVDLSLCKNIGSHLISTPMNQNVYQYEPMFPPKKPSDPVEKNGGGRRFSGRRAMTMNFMGSFCGHTCPETCTDDYSPECALSTNGVRQVFANHCRLDEHSCVYGVIWKKRPLAECVGGKRADMQQNRAFISWMQRVGIVDRKGKLVLE